MHVANPTRYGTTQKATSTHELELTPTNPPHQVYYSSTAKSHQSLPASRGIKQINTMWNVWVSFAPVLSDGWTYEIKQRL